MNEIINVVQSNETIFVSANVELRIEKHEKSRIEKYYLSLIWWKLEKIETAVHEKECGLSKYILQLYSTENSDKFKLQWDHMYFYIFCAFHDFYFRNHLLWGLYCHTLSRKDIYEILYSEIIYTRAGRCEIWKFWVGIKYKILQNRSFLESG